MANLISAADVPGFPLLSPIERSVSVSDAVNSTYPSPDAICWAETAPLAHPAHPEVFVKTDPLAEVSTRLVHCTALALAVGVGEGLGLGAGDGAEGDGPDGEGDELPPAPAAGNSTRNVSMRELQSKPAGEPSVPSQ
jgi:hypothetical protein